MLDLSAINLYNKYGFYTRKECRLMNSAKRISNQTIKNDNSKMDKDKGRSSQPHKKGIIISAVCGVIVLFLVVMVLWENLHPKLIFTINGEKVYLNDIMVDIYMSESTGAYMNSLYQQNYGSDYWSIVNDDGMTNAELLKDSSIEVIMQKYMMYYEALDNGYTLSDEEKQTAESQAKEVFDQMTSKTKNKTGISRQDIVDYYEMQTLADNYKSAWIDTFDIDDAALTADIDPAQYRQYDIQYYYVPFSGTDDSGETVDMTDDEKAAAVEELKASYDDIAGLSDFTTYVNNSSGQTSTEEGQATPTPAPGPTAPEGSNIKYSSKSFIETDETDFDAELLADIKKMDNEEISRKVVQDSKGCYIIKMVNNNSTERYDSECESVITSAENEKFSEEIDNLEVEKYLIEFNDTEWDKLEFGSITVGD